MYRQILPPVFKKVIQICSETFLLVHADRRGGGSGKLAEATAFRYKHLFWNKTIPVGKKNPENNPFTSRLA
jgi:hypothetical protein